MLTLNKDKHSQPIGKGAGILDRVRIDTPLSRTGSHYALIPERLISKLSGGGLRVMAAICGLHRPSRALKLTFRELADSLSQPDSRGTRSRMCSRTLAGHLGGLRDLGLVHAHAITPTALALPSHGERFARVPLGRISVMSGATFRPLAACLLHTDRKGRRRVSWRWLAGYLECSRRTVMHHVAKLRSIGIPLARRVFRRAAKTFTCGLKKLAHLSRKVVSRKEVLSNEGKKARHGPLTVTEFEDRRRKAQAQLAHLIAQEAPA